MLHDEVDMEVVVEVAEKEREKWTRSSQSWLLRRLEDRFDLADLV